MLVKRLTDLFLTVAAVPLWLPLLSAIAVLVRWRLGAPVLFRQKRPGRNGVIFEIIKFRTMIDRRDASGGLLRDAERLTPFGRWLRSTSLDELPEFINVLRGEMSLVGPRPLLPQYLKRYTLRQNRRHEVRPGITGWAQVNGRNEIGWEERLEMDVWYVDHQSTWLDIVILWRTVTQVVKRRGINAPDAATMSEFAPKDYK